MGGLRELAASFVVPGPSGVAVRTRLKQLTPADEKVLALVGAHLGALASGDLRARCADGLDHSAQTWAVRKRALTAVSSSRWAGSLTKATHDQWALARRGRLAHIQSLEAGIHTIAHRLSLPVGTQILATGLTPAQSLGTVRGIGRLRGGARETPGRGRSPSYAGRGRRTECVRSRCGADRCCRRRRAPRPTS